MLSAGTPAATNSITDPTAVVPRTSAVSGLGASFSRTFRPYSVTVLALST